MRVGYSCQKVGVRPVNRLNEVDGSGAVVCAEAEPRGKSKTHRGKRIVLAACSFEVGVGGEGSHAIDKYLPQLKGENFMQFPATVGYVFP